MKIFLLTLFTLALGFNVYAQKDSPLRIEIDAETNQEVFGIALESKSFVIVKHQNKSTTRGETWIMELYDSDMKKYNSSTLSMPTGFVPVDYKLNGDSVLWLCFSEPEGKKGSFKLFRYNMQTGLLWKKFAKGSRKAVIDGFEIVGNKVILLGERLFDLQNQLVDANMPYGISIIYTDIPNQSKIITSKSMSDNSQAIIIVENDDRDNKGLFIYNYTNNSSTPVISKLNALAGVNVIDGSLIENNDGSLLLMGTYNYNIGPDGIREQIAANGTYIAKLENYAFTFFKTNEFSDYKNVFATLSAKEHKQIKDKTSKGKDPKLSFKVLTHKKALRQEDLYVIALELYHPEYHYENSYDSRGYMFQQLVFDGYRTSNCLVAAFSKEGDLVWDNYMHTNNLLELSLQENVIVFDESDTNIVMAYYYNSSIFSKTVNGNDIVFKKSEDKIQIAEGEKVVTERYGRMQRWYDNYFIVSGYQILYGQGNSKRRVYFFNLISFD